MPGLVPYWKPHCAAPPRKLKMCPFRVAVWPPTPVAESVKPVGAGHESGTQPATKALLCLGVSTPQPTTGGGQVATHSTGGPHSPSHSTGGGPQSSPRHCAAAAPAGGIRNTATSAAANAAIQILMGVPPLLGRTRG